jgi:hypothetical protein
MRSTFHGGALLGLSVLAAVATLAAAAPPTRLKLAQDLARAHAAWPQGREWIAQNRAKTEELIVPVLNRCVPDSPEEGELTAFSLYLRLSQKGRIEEVVTDVGPELGVCMTREAAEVQLPEAPRDDFWIRLNLAATL